MSNNNWLVRLLLAQIDLVHDPVFTTAVEYMRRVRHQRQLQCSHIPPHYCSFSTACNAGIILKV